MPRFLASLLALTAISGGQSTQTFTGTIADDMCVGDHSQMRMGPTDGDCTNACVVAHGAAYVLYDGKEAYRLSDQKTPEQFAGQMVRVTGTLDPRTKTIRVDSITSER